MHPSSLSSAINYDAYYLEVQEYVGRYGVKIDDLIPTRSTILSLVGIQEVYSQTPVCDFFVNTEVYNKLYLSPDFTSFRPFSSIEMPMGAGIIYVKEISNREENMYKEDKITFSGLMSLRNVDVLSIIYYLQDQESVKAEDFHSTRVLKFLTATISNQAIPYHFLASVYKAGIFAWWEVTDSAKETVRKIISSILSSDRSH